MNIKHFINTDGRESNIEHLYVRPHGDGYILDIIGFEEDPFRDTIWVHPKIANYLNDPNYTVDNINFTQEAEFFYYLLMNNLSDIIAPSSFGKNSPEYPYLHFIGAEQYTDNNY